MCRASQYNAANGPSSGANILTSPALRSIDSLTLDALQPILRASLDEGYHFIQQLWDEYQSGINRFDGEGAVLMGLYRSQTMAAIGGVHPDPYLQRRDIGRVRHVYVLPEHRRAKIGGLLMSALIDHSHDHFAFLTLRTLTAHGDAFYSALGFSREPRFEQATHWLALGGKIG